MTMWACVLTFDNGNTSPMYSQTYDGILQAISDMIKTWNAPIREIHLHRMVNARQIKQGRIDEYVR